VGVHDPGNPYSDPEGFLTPERVWRCNNEAEAPRRLSEAYKHERPDMVLLFSDIAICGQWARALFEAAGGQIPIPVVIYCPVDGGGMVPGLVDWAAKEGEESWFSKLQIITYTRWGAGVIGEALRAAGKPQEIPTLPHAVDTDSFYPMDWRIAREEMGISEAVGDSFILLNANTNTPRKRIDVTLAAWAQFLAREPDARAHGARLLLHMTPFGSWDVRALFERECRAAGVDNWGRYLILPPDDHKEMWGCPARILNLRYNAAPVGITTSGGEGWGLTSWEHAACGRPQIVADYAAHGEIFPRGAAYHVKPAAYITAPHHLQIHAVLSPSDVAEKIAEAWRAWITDDISFVDVAEAGYQAATAITWEEITCRLDMMLRAVLE
jgi:glycosyltransferase involved in cell wall biosynthesis